MLYLPNTLDFQDYFQAVCKFALEQQLFDNLLDKLHYLAHYAEVDDSPFTFNLTRCWLAKDFAPQSFSFVMQRLRKPSQILSQPARAQYLGDNNNWENWFQGGLIYQGPGCPADGSAPSFTVSLASGVGWFVHT